MCAYRKLALPNENSDARGQTHGPGCAPDAHAMCRSEAIKAVLELSPEWRIKLRSTSGIVRQVLSTRRTCFVQLPQHSAV